MRLLAELVDIPERVHRGDFVFKLAEGLEHPAETLASYVVTPELARCFDEALGLVGAASEANSSRAAYLAGSFGSGKSAFMAVLHLLLGGHPEARAKRELAEVIAKHDEWLAGKRFFMVPLHLLGSSTLEQAVLGGYVEQVRRRHPEAPTPAVYPSAAVFANAVELRATMGDAAFFTRLSSGAASVDAGWGDLAVGWDASRFERAVGAAAGVGEADELLSALVDTWLPAYRDLAGSAVTAFVPIDAGLSVIARHAAQLGYDGLVLFLDELVLWLASRIAERDWVGQEASKLAKLVEAAHVDRPVPIVSFVARQRDLRELVGEHVPGAEHLSLSDLIGWADGRFEFVRLEDRNLPAIASQRLLRPRNDAARVELDRAFAETEKVRTEVMDTLLASDGDRAMFRLTYPFSPACVKTLVALSQALQRERTALKVMAHLLSERRADLAVGDLIGVGDLWDVLADGDEPFTEALKASFDAAKKLYRGRIRPLLCELHDVSEETARALPRAHPFRADDTIAKTLLLAALVPDVEPLKNLTAARLAALNHGSIRSPIKGQERTVVLGKVRDWASRLGELKLTGDGANPIISLHLTGVDTEAIVARLRGVDNEGLRRQTLRRLVFTRMGLDPEQHEQQRDVLWRGTRRKFEVRFGNVRDTAELPDTALRAGLVDTGRIVVDFPFDDGYGPGDDLARLDAWRSLNAPSRTVCWLPAFFTARVKADLGTYVVLDHVLAGTGERLAQEVASLPPAEREIARSLLTNQRDALRQRLFVAIDQAYGVATAVPETIETSHELGEMFASLDPSFTPRPPVGATLAEAFDDLAGQMLAQRFPAHPPFEDEVKARDLRAALDELRRAMTVADGRVNVDRPLRAVLRRVVNPLRLGEMHEQYLVSGDHWRGHFESRIGSLPAGEPLTVGRLRAWLDEPKPMGLLRDAANLVIVAFAEQTNRSFVLHGRPMAAALDTCDDEWEVRAQTLPADDVWSVARDRAAALFGLAPPAMRSASTVGALAAEVVERARASRPAAEALASELSARVAELGVSGQVARLDTASEAVSLLGALDTAGPEGAVELLGTIAVHATLAALARSTSSAAAVTAKLKAANWTLLGAAAVDDVKLTLVDVLRRDELTEGLVAALHKAEHEATRRLVVDRTVVLPPPTHPPVPAGPPAVPVRPGSPMPPISPGSPGPGLPPLPSMGLQQRQALDEAGVRQVVDELLRALEADPEARVDITWTVRPGESA